MCSEVLLPGSVQTSPVNENESINLLFFFASTCNPFFHFFKLPLSWPTSFFPSFFFLLSHLTVEGSEREAWWSASIQPRSTHHIWLLHTSHFNFVFILGFVVGMGFFFLYVAKFLNKDKAVTGTVFWILENLGIITLINCKNDIIST